MIGPLYDDHARIEIPEVELPEVGECVPPEPEIRPVETSIRGRLHVICALYAHTQQPDRRLALLDHLERLTFEAAELLATHLLASGWRPQASSTEPTSKAA